MTAFDSPSPPAGSRPSDASLSLLADSGAYDGWARVAQAAPEDTAPAGIKPDSWAQIKNWLGAGQDVNFTTAEENQQSGTQPDYILGADGTLRANPHKTTPPEAGQPITVQVESSEGKEGAQRAAQQLKIASVNEKIAYWRADPKNRGSADIPEHLKAELATAQGATPLIRDDAAFNNLRMPTVPQDQPAPQTDAPAPRSAGPGGAPRSFAGQGGFDNRGYFNGSGTQNEGRVWTGQMDTRGAPIGEGEQAKAKDIYDYFIEKGLTSAQASGILGNIQTESTFNTAAHNKGEGAIGICQWRLDRRTALESFAAEQNKPVTDLRVQLDFIWKELNSTHSGALVALKAAKTPEEAAAAFQSKYEKSAHLGDRPANARQFYAMFSGRENTATV